MPRAPERDIMEDWILVQPCPKCDLKRLMLGEAVISGVVRQYTYTCTNGDCCAAGRFGYATTLKKVIVFHPRSIWEDEDANVLKELNIQIKSTPVEPKQHRMDPRAWGDDDGGFNQVTWEEYGRRYGASFTVARHARETKPDVKDNPCVKGSPEHRGWEDGWHFEERGLPEHADEKT